MVSLQGIDALVKAGKETGNHVTTVEIFNNPENKGEQVVAITFEKGLEMAYAQEAAAGAGNPTMQQSEQNLATSPEISVDVLAQEKNTTEVVDTADIHLEHRTIDTNKVKGEIEVSGTPAAFTEMAQNIAAMTQEQQAQPFYSPEAQQQIMEQIATQQPAAAATSYQPTISQLEVKEFITDNANVTFYNDAKSPIVRVEFNEETVDFNRLKEQLNTLAAEGVLGEQGQKLVDDALKEIVTKYPNFALPQQENAVIIQPQPELQASASADERGHEGRRKPDMLASAQTSVEPQSVKMEQPLVQVAPAQIGM